jgi:hypothetical protein
MQNLKILRFEHGTTNRPTARIVCVSGGSIGYPQSKWMADLKSIDPWQQASQQKKTFSAASTLTSHRG